MIQGDLESVKSINIIVSAVGLKFIFHGLPNTPPHSLASFKTRPALRAATDLLSALLSLFSSIGYKTAVHIAAAADEGKPGAQSQALCHQIIK